jgi:hypothetical protein
MTPAASLSGGAPRPDDSRGAAGTITLGRPAPLVLLVVAATVVVAVASNGLILLAARADLGAGATWAVRLAGVTLIAIGAAALAANRERVRREGHRKDPALGGIRAATTIMGAVTLLAMLNPPPSPDPGRRDGVASMIPGLPPFGGSSPPGSAAVGSRGGDSRIQGRALPDEIEGMTVTAVGESAPTGVLGRVFGLLPLLLFLAIVYMIHRAFRHTPEGRELRAPEFLPPVEQRAAEQGLEASLLAMGEHGPDPRGQITQAYHRLLAALAAAGAPREPHEAPFEHLQRVLTPLGVASDALHRLTRLYVLAQFSERSLGEEHRSEARASLQASLSALREAATPKATT